MPLDPLKIKSDFPIFDSYPSLIYLDSASTSQKPKPVIDAVSNFYRTKNANIHRGIYSLAENATEIYEYTRSLLKSFINAYNDNEIIFTKNTNESINLAAFGWAKKYLKRRDTIVLSVMEHHANIVPWLKLRDEIGVELFFLPITKDGRLLYSEIEKIRNKNIKLFALTHISNTLGTVNPLVEIIPYFKKQAPDAKILIDAAQSIAHMPIDVQKFGIDFLAFSSHKMYGPSGVGVLWSKEAILENMDPFLVGSNMIKKVTMKKATWADLPAKFETGTPNLEGVAGLAAAIEYIQRIGFKNIQYHDQQLTAYAVEKLTSLPYLTIYGPQSTKDRAGIFSLGMQKIHPHDIAQILDTEQICVRSGHHCTQVLMDQLGVLATARASFSIYNTPEDVDALIAGLEKVKKTFHIQ